MNKNEQGKCAMTNSIEKVDKKIYNIKTQKDIQN